VNQVKYGHEAVLEKVAGGQIAGALHERVAR
jgi:hypothetical protein